MDRPRPSSRVFDPERAVDPSLDFIAGDDRAQTQNKVTDG
jgi:hypothetical protein